MQLLQYPHLRLGRQAGLQAHYISSFLAQSHAEKIYRALHCRLCQHRNAPAETCDK